MNLLHVHDFFAPGNSRYGFDLDRLLVARGHRVHVLAGTGPQGPEDGTSIDGVEFHTYAYGEEGRALSRYRYAVRRNSERFTELHGRHRFDLLVLNQPLCAAGVTSDAIAARLPKVYSFISPWAEEWRIAHPDAGWFVRAFHYGWRRRLERKALQAADLVMVESRFIESELFRVHPGTDRGKVRLIPGAVDLRRFVPDGTPSSNRARFGLPPEATILLTLRRLVSRMGIENLVDALPELPGVVLVVGGDGPLRSDLQSRAERSGVAGRVRFLGYVREEDLPFLYRAADLFVLPTRELEGFGLVAIEAMACGTPAAGTPVGAIPEVLGPLDRRLLLPGTSPSEIARGLSALLRGKESLEALRSRCRAYVAGRFDWANVIADVERLFLGVVRS